MRAVLARAVLPRAAPVMLYRCAVDGRMSESPSTRAGGESGEVELADKCEAAAQRIKRDVVFAASLYL